MTDQPEDPKPKATRMTKLDLEQERERKRMYEQQLKEYREFTRQKMGRKSRACGAPGQRMEKSRGG